MTGIDQLVKDLIKQELKEFRKQLFTDLSEIKPPEKKWYSIKEVSHITGLTHNALKGRHKLKTLNFVREGNVLLMNVVDLSLLLDTLEQQRQRNKTLYKGTLKY